MRLIDADKLIGVLVNISVLLQQEGTVVSGPMQKFYENFVEIVKSQPTVDAVKVVRCKDCKYWRGDGFWDGFWCFVSSYPDKKVPAYHFCGCGEKREGKQCLTE